MSQMYESCQSDQWVMLPMNESCHKDQRVMSRRCMSHVTQINESCHSDGWVMSQRWMSHVTQVNESYHSNEWAMSRILALIVIWVIEWLMCNDAWHCDMSHWINDNNSCHNDHMESWHSIAQTLPPNCATVQRWHFVNDSCHICISHVTDEWVISLRSMSHVTHMNSSLHAMESCGSVAQ